MGVAKADLTSTALTSVTATAQNFAATVDTLTVTGGTLTGFTPYAVIYTQIGGDGNYHLYSANISNSAVAPTPQQMSSLSVTPSANPFDGTCVFQAYQNLTSPTSAFVIVEVPTAGTACNSGGTGNQFWLIHLGDTAATAPTALPAGVATVEIAPSYTAAGALTGLSLVNSSKNLAFYPASGGASVISAATGSIATNVTSVSSLGILSDRTAHALAGGTVVFFQVVDNVSSNNVIYRIDAAGTGTNVYSTTGSLNGFGNIGGSVHDNTNIYLYDAAGTAPTFTSVKFVELPLAGGASTTLFTDAAPGAGTTYELIDSDGNRLIYKKKAVGSVSLLTLTTGGASSPATLVNSATAFDLSAFLDFGADHLFVNTISLTSPVSSAVYTPASSVAIPSQGGPNTYFAAFNSLFSFGTAGTSRLFEFTNVTESYPSLGLASLFTMDASTFAKVQVTQSGSNYVVPTGSELLVFPQSLSIGGAAVLNVAGGGTYTGVVIDVSRAQMITIVAPNTSVVPE